ncbi:MAG: carbohydrate-binding domain-containing protein [Lachnospiraceae bacterium]|nr:carbohydrate-binding domain-containing protein [Lachnospiraceae bacterium]
MKKRNNAAVAAISVLILSVLTTGCTPSGPDSQAADGMISSGNATVDIQNDITQSADDVSSSDTASSEKKDLFTERDLKQTADETGATTLTVADNTTLAADSEGVYILSGAASNCTLRVDAGEDAKVQIVLKNADISNDDFPCIYVVSAKKVFITTGENTENSLKVTGEFNTDGDTNTDAVIFAKDDIVLNGLGLLNINSAKGNGITGKDDVKFTGGTYSIVTSGNGIEAKDSLSICDGSYNITSSKSAIRCRDKDDTSKGSAYFSGGTFTVSAGDNGIQAVTGITIDDGSFDISSSEGMETTVYKQNGGSVTIKASDDGINVSDKSSAFTPTVTINGGSLNITMGAGDTDAIDVNGSLYVNGGEINITARFAFDFDNEALLNGGNVIVNGEQVTEIVNSMQAGPGGPGGPDKPDGKGAPGGPDNPDGQEMPDDADNE